MASQNPMRKCSLVELVGLTCMLEGNVMHGLLILHAFDPRERARWLDHTVSFIPEPIGKERR